MSNINKQQRVTSILKRGTKGHVIVTDNLEETFTPFYEVEITYGTEYFAPPTAYFSLMRITFVNFKTRTIKFILFKDDADTLIENNPEA
jgi:hypothetical protein